MKKLIATIIGIIVAIGAMMAQSSQLATLSHKGTIQTFYGANALMDAHAVAVNGDVITLSSGSFNGGTITKAITIRGAGVGMDTINNTLPTIINSVFYLNATANDSSYLVLEGLSFSEKVWYYNITRPMFLKCKFTNISRVGNVYSGGMTDVTFMHCLISGTAYMEESTGTIINSVFGLIWMSNFTCVNSYFIDMRGISNCSFRNCIIITQVGSDDNRYAGRLGSSNLAYNCIGYNKFCNIFLELPDHASDKTFNPETCLMVGNNFLYYANHEKAWFQLSAQGKTYLGDDGKEVGIYGGNMPFDLRTTTPQITKCNVAAKSTVDGKLSVDIEVSEIE